MRHVPSVTERMPVDQAKRLLMASRKQRESETCTPMRHMAHDQKRRIGEVAEELLAMREALPPSPPSGQ